MAMILFDPTSPAATSNVTVKSSRLAPSSRQLALEALAISSTNFSAGSYVEYDEFEDDSEYPENNFEYSSTKYPSDEDTIIPSRYQHDIASEDILDSWAVSLKTSMILALLEATRANKKTLESRFSFFASEQAKLKDRLDEQELMVNSIIDHQRQCDQGLSKAVNAKQENNRKVVLLVATRNRVVQMLWDMYPKVDQTNSHHEKIKSKLYEFRYRIEESIENEEKLMKLLGKQKMPWGW